MTDSWDDFRWRGQSTHAAVERSWPYMSRINVLVPTALSGLEDVGRKVRRSRLLSPPAKCRPTSGECYGKDGAVVVGE